MTLLKRALWPAYEWRLRRLRRRLETAFSDETAAPGFPRLTPSAGQCAAVSVVVHFGFGAGLASAQVQCLSHWFNRIRVGHSFVDVDLTGDQFGKPDVQVGPSDSLYGGTRSREPVELHNETLERAERLAARAGLVSVREGIAKELQARRRAEHIPSSTAVSRTG